MEGPNKRTYKHGKWSVSDGAPFTRLTLDRDSAHKHGGQLAVSSWLNTRTLTSDFNLIQIMVNLLSKQIGINGWINILQKLIG